MKHMPHIHYIRIPEYPPLAAISRGGHSLSNEVKPT
jgi:hypothetical protein